MISNDTMATEQHFRSVTSLWPLNSVCWSVGLTLKGGKLSFDAHIGALAYPWMTLPASSLVRNSISSVSFVSLAVKKCFLSIPSKFSKVDYQSQIDNFRLLCPSVWYGSFPLSAYLSFSEQRRHEWEVAKENIWSIYNVTSIITLICN